MNENLSTYTVVALYHSSNDRNHYLTTKSLISTSL